MYVDIGKTIVTQNFLRNPEKVKKIIVSMMMDEEIEPVKLYKVEDGKFFVHDGHHRLTASYILDTDIRVDGQIFTYDMFTQINHDVGWVTPHDIRKRVRKSDLFSWKNKVKQLKKELPLEELNKFIYESEDVYSHPRVVWTVKDFVKNSEYLQDLFLTVRR